MRMIKLTSIMVFLCGLMACGPSITSKNQANSSQAQLNQWPDITGKPAPVIWPEKKPNNISDRLDSDFIVPKKSCSPQLPLTQTIDHPLITELSSKMSYTPFDNQSISNMQYTFFAVEIYNPTDQPIDLKNLRLRLPSVRKSQLDDTTNILSKSYEMQSTPSNVLAPKAYLVLLYAPKLYKETQNLSLSVTDTTTLLIPDETYEPVLIKDNKFWAVDLTDADNHSYDFISVNDNTAEKFNYTATQWDSKNAVLLDSMEYQPNNLQVNFLPAMVARSAPYKDTNTDKDWIATGFNTLGADNISAQFSSTVDSMYQLDTDNDGIPDGLEDGLNANGQPEDCEFFAGIPYYQLGARKETRDIFHHVQLANLPKSLISNQALLKLQEETLSMKEIQLKIHLDLGTLFSKKVDRDRMNLGLHQPFLYDVNSEQFINSSFFYRRIFMVHPRSWNRAIYSVLRGTDTTIVSPVCNMYNYSLQNPSSGIIELLIPFEFSQNLNQFNNYLAAVIAHGTGHGMKLDDSISPYQLSVMSLSYLRQLPSDNPDWDAEAFALSYCSCRSGFSYNSQLSPGEKNLIDNPIGTYQIDFSSRKIKADRYDESKGLLRDKSTWVDFNCNGKQDIVSKLDNFCRFSITRPSMAASNEKTLMKHNPIQTGIRAF